MSCLSCRSNNNTEFVAELIIHFSGLENLDRPGVWAFPRLLVCLDCGFSYFILQKSQLEYVATDVRAPETVAPARCHDSFAFHSRIALGPE
jgi:hypothetical protein